MTAKGYCQPYDVFAHLGRTPTAAQVDEASELISSAEDWIDRYTGRAWMEAATVEDHFDLTGPLVVLSHAPVTSIASVKVLYSWTETTETTLVAGTDYEQRDLAAGLLWLPGWASYHRIRATYTPSVAAPPAAIVLATKKLAAWWMRPVLGDGGDGIRSFSVGGELSVTYQDAATERGAPAEVLALLAPYKRLVFA